MKHLKGSLVFGLFAITMIATGMSNGANAQNIVDYSQVMKSLNASSDTARRVGIDTGAIRRNIEARIKAEGTENATAPFSVLDELKKLPQLIVQIQFNLDADTIRPQSWVTVGRIADALHHPLLASNRFLIVGHTDSRGKRQYNLDLSERRALSVAAMLTSVFRVNSARLLAMGLGEEQLFDRKNPKNDVNRRVEFFNMGPN